MLDKAAAIKLVYQELSKVNTGKRIAQSRIFLLCPFGKHNDTVPSLSVNLDPTSQYNPGSFYCFGCGEKGGWNKLAGQLGLQGYDGKRQAKHYQPPDVQSRTKHMLEVVDKDLESIITEWDCIMPMPFSKGDSWRGIKGRLLRRIGANYAYDNRFKKIRIILPCFVYGELEGVIRASQQQETISYLNSKGTWVKSKGLFPFDYVNKRFTETDYVVLVEGSRDSLRLIQEDIPALSIMGTNSWNEKKRDLVLSLGKRVFSMMDGDLPKKKGIPGPGAKANKLIKSSLQEIKVECRVINLSKVALKLGHKVDPANASRKLIDRVKEIVCRG